MLRLAFAVSLISGTAAAQTGPGFGNLAYDPSEVFTPVGYVESPHGHGNVAMVQGYLMVIYSSDGGGSVTDGGIEFWDVSNPRAPMRAIAYDTPETHGLREAHGFSLARYGTNLLLAAQGEIGIQIWDVTDPHAIVRLAELDLDGIDPGDYSGDWWLSWQAPYVFVAGTDSGLYVVDASDPSAPSVVAQVPTGDLGGVSPAQVFVIGNLALIAESQGSALASIDIAVPDRPRLLRQVDGRAGYSHLLAGAGKILTSGNIPPRAHFLQLTADGDISYLATVGLFFNSGGYGSYQDGYFHSGFSNNYVKFQIDPPTQIGTGSSGRADRDEDFATVLGNITFAGDDHGVGTALIPHQAAPDTSPPVVEWMHPPSGSTEVALTTRIGLSFSDTIDAASVDETTLRLEDDTGTAVPALRSVQLGLVNLSPAGALDLSRTYRVIAEGVRDVAGNASPRFEGTITTGDGSVPLSPTAAVTNVDVNIAFGSYALGIFAEGRRVYSDRDYTFTAQFPPRFDRQAYLRTANIDKNNFLTNFLTFDLLAPAEVAVLYDARASAIPNWMSGFMPTGETVVTTDATFDVYTRNFPIGQVALGGNSGLGSSGAQTMYSVVIVPEPIPCAIDLSPALTGTVTLSANGPAGGTYEWRVAGRTLSGPNPDVFLAPGRYSVTLSVVSGPLGASCSGVKIVHRPLVAEPARASSRLVWVGGHTINVNPDSGTVSRIDPGAGQLVFEVPAGRRPETLAVNGSELWVVDRTGARVHVLSAETGAELRSIALPWGSAPFGVVIDPEGTAFVTLGATGEVAKIAADGTIVARSAVTPTARGITWFDGRLYVTRFISPDERGEVHVLDAATLNSLGVIALGVDPGPDTEASGRGLPNYVAEVQISPDGVQGFVPSKKDNILRGVYRDGQPLTFETRVRAIVSPFEVATASAAVSARLDLNDRELATSILVSPYGDLLFVASQGGNIIDVFDLARKERVSQFDVGRAPNGLALEPSGDRLAVLNFLSRSVGYYDVAGLVHATSNASRELAVVTSIRNEPLDAQVLAGKRIFFDASDDRMSRDNYLSCASCHLDGGHDGRTWDFTQSGEGLRNTIALVGRAGTGGGKVHWTANFDEIQDFEHDIRGAFGGTGFLSDADFAATSDPLGAPKAGLSVELDALAAYVTSLAEYPASPHRAADGTLELEARRGREVFLSSGCAVCHAGATFTDGLRHDVGTIRPSSGKGIGVALEGVGFDTPTLRGIFETAPYFHDGSAATLGDVLDRHGMIPALTGAARDDLLAYLLALDGTSLAPEAPCGVECVEPVIPAPDAGVVEMDAGSVPAADAGDAGVAVEPPAPAMSAGCGCSATRGGEDVMGALLLGLALAFVLRRRANA